MFIFLLFPSKKKKIHSTRVYQTRVLYNFFFFFKKGTRAWSTRVLCNWYSSLPSSSTAKFFLIAQIQLSNATMAKLMRNSSFWDSSSRKSGTLLLFPKQCLFAKNFQKLWYWAILAKESLSIKILTKGPCRDGWDRLKSLNWTKRCPMGQRMS